MIDVNDLAQEIRRVDGKHMMGAGALAEALLPFIEAAIAGSTPAPPTDATADVAPSATTEVVSPADKFEALLDNVAAIRDEYLRKRQEALDQMEIHASHGDIVETSIASSEAERHSASALAASRILKLCESANV